MSKKTLKIRCGICRQNDKDAPKHRICNPCGKEWWGKPECPSCYAEDSSVIGDSLEPTMTEKESQK